MTQSANKDEITLSEVLQLLRQEMWLAIAISVMGVGLSIAYAKLATEWFRAEVVLTPAEQKRGLSGSLGALGGLAGIAGIDLGTNDSAEPIATLKSGEFTRNFIAEQNLLPVLFADEWDATAKRWKGTDKKKWPDLRDGARLFDRKIRKVDEDTKSRLVVLTIEWTDPVAATTWANLLVEKLNERMRQRALLEAERNIEYLRQELTRSDIVTLHESVSRLLENEMQKMMLARGNSEYSFRVVDRAETPKWRSSPKRIQVVVLGSIAATLLGIFVAVIRGRRRASRA